MNPTFFHNPGAWCAFIFFVSSTYTGRAQVQRYAPVMLGVESSGVIVDPTPAAEGSIVPMHVVRVAPRLDVRVGRRTYVGVQYEYGFGKYNFVPLERRHGFGVLGRTYLPIDSRRYRFIRDRLLLYGEGSWNLLDYYVDLQSPFGYETLHRFSNHSLQAVAGLHFRLFDKLYLDLALRGHFYTHNRLAQSGTRIGLQYHFKEVREFKKQETTSPARPREKKPHPLDFGYFLKHFSASVAWSFIFDDDDTGWLFYYKQHYAYLTLRTSLTSAIDVGLGVMPVWTSVDDASRQRFLLAGPIVQYDFVRYRRRGRAFVELGLFTGDMCLCGDGVAPYRHPRLLYLPIGAGGELPLFSQHLFARYSVHWLRILNGPERVSSAAHPTLGLTYRFGQE